MGKWYGNLSNRIDENKMFCNKIEVGTPATTYDWSDRHAWEVISVTDQKHIVIRELKAKKKPGAEWYENSWILESDPDGREKTLEKRGKYWYAVAICTPETAKRALAEKGDLLLWAALNGFNAEEIASGTRTRKRFYRESISFGKADYYYDYEF